MRYILPLVRGGEVEVDVDNSGNITYMDGTADPIRPGVYHLTNAAGAAYGKISIGSYGVRPTIAEIYQEPPLVIMIRVQDPPWTYQFLKDLGRAEACVSILAGKPCEECGGGRQHTAEEVGTSRENLKSFIANFIAKARERGIEQRLNHLLQDGTEEELRELWLTKRIAETVLTRLSMILASEGDQFKINPDTPEAIGRE